jgi:transaldolase
MRKSGVNDYKNFAYEVLATVSNRPVSFEVLADDFNEMERQAHIISSWGDNVNVKIPITNTSGELSTSLIRRLSSEQIKLNITAILTLDRVMVESGVWHQDQAATRSTSVTSTPSLNFTPVITLVK